MSFLNDLKTEANYTTTFNGAKAYRSTNDSCLDLFAVAGGMRYRSKNAQIQMFERAYIENPDLAMKLLFYIRDIKEGLGEREMFRTLLRHVAKVWPKSAKKNVHLISKYGRWDDLICLMGTKAQDEVVNVIRTQLEKDMAAVKSRENGNPKAEISLLAKWMPSCNTSSARTRGQAKVLMRALGMNAKSYRKMLSKLRSHSCITERYLTKNQTEKIKYETVPAGAMLKYRSAFERHDLVRFSKYIDDVTNGNAKIHSDTLFPYEILRPYFENRRFNNVDLYIKGENVLEALWENQDNIIGQKNVVSVIDTSGSMYWSMPDTPTPALISQALGLYYAERCQGIFHNHFITFESTPHIVEIPSGSLRDKLRYISTIPWGCTTNIEAVFNLILNTAIRTGARQEEMPEVIYIISDMEFNMAFRDPDKTIFDNAKEAFENAGYELPAVVFHNVNSWHQQMPVLSHTRGAALVSGAGKSSFKHKFDGNVTPMSHMLRILNSKRYEEIKA